MALVTPDYVQHVAGDSATATHAAAAVTYTAQTNQRHMIWQIDYGYSASPAAPGTLKIEDVSGTTVFLLPVTDAGPQQIKFNPPLIGAAVNTAMIVTLSDGGASVVGYVNVTHTEG